MELIKISLTAQPQIILTHAGSCQNSDSGGRREGAGRKQRYKLPTQAHRHGTGLQCPCSLSWETPLCALLTEEQ